MYRHIDRYILTQLMKTTALRSIALAAEARTDNVNILAGTTNARTGSNLGLKGSSCPTSKPHA